MPPPALISLATRSAASNDREMIRTLQPTSPSLRAMPLPMPRLAPVTMAVRPAIVVNMAGSPRMVFLFGCFCQQLPVVQRRHHLYAAHISRLVGGVVADRVVHRADVVPHQYVANRPVVRIEIFSALLMAEQEV